jgi:glutaredoxin 3
MQTNLSNKRAVVWSQTNCPACNQAKTLLDTKGISYEVKMLGADVTKQDLLEAVPGARSVPQIFLDSKYIGGLDALRKALT